MKMYLQISGFGYDYYMGKSEHGEYVYNAVPNDQQAPAGGYPNKDYILRIKHIPDLFSDIYTETPQTNQQ